MASRTLVIGDIHGQMRQFGTLLDSLSIASGDTVVLLGDLVDRGPDSSRVLQTAIGLTEACHLITIMGNHEQMMLAARESHSKLSDWINNGGDTTLRSYAGTRSTLRDVPAGHWQFLTAKLLDYWEDSTHLFVHANARPDLPMTRQPDYMLRWERCDKSAAHVSGKTLVCGHTPQVTGRPKNAGYGICLDTNVCGGGPLTALDTQSGRVWQAFLSGRVERSHISDYGDNR